MHFHIMRRNPGSVLAASCPVLCSGCETAEGSEWVKGVYIPARTLPQQQQGSSGRANAIQGGWLF